MKEGYEARKKMWGLFQRGSLPELFKADLVIVRNEGSRPMRTFRGESLNVGRKLRPKIASVCARGGTEYLWCTKRGEGEGR